MAIPFFGQKPTATFDRPWYKKKGFEKHFTEKQCGY